MWGVNHPTLLETQNFMTPCYFGAPIKAFESTAKKYNIDFSLKKVKGEQTRYLVFFKGRDADVMTAAFQEFSAKKLNREKKPSIRKALAAAKDKAKQLNAARDKVKKMDRGREI